MTELNILKDRFYHECSTNKSQIYNIDTVTYNIKREDTNRIKYAMSSIDIVKIYRDNFKFKITRNNNSCNILFYNCTDTEINQILAHIILYIETEKNKNLNWAHKIIKENSHE